MSRGPEIRVSRAAGLKTGHSGNLMGGRQEVETAAVKVDGDLQVLAIAETVGVFFTVWIFEFRPSLAALVRRCSQ